MFKNRTAALLCSHCKVTSLVTVLFGAVDDASTLTSEFFLFLERRGFELVASNRTVFFFYDDSRLRKKERKSDRREKGRERMCVLRVRVACVCVCVCACPCVSVGVFVSNCSSCYKDCFCSQSVLAGEILIR